LRKPPRIELAARGDKAGEVGTSERLALFADADLGEPLGGGVGRQAAGHTDRKEPALGLVELVDLDQDVGLGPVVDRLTDLAQVEVPYPHDRLPPCPLPVHHPEYDHPAPGIREADHRLPQLPNLPLPCVRRLTPILELEGLGLQGIGRLSIEPVQEVPCRKAVGHGGIINQGLMLCQA
jgi:hypothetical protein